MAKLPHGTYLTGWPQKLTDTAGDEYWRLRDGKPNPPPKGTRVPVDGQICKYGRIVDWKDEEETRPIVEGDVMYVPTGTDTENVKMNSGDWIDQGDLEDTFEREELV